MRRRFGVVVLSALLVGMFGVPALASPPEVFEAPWTFAFPDFGNELVAFINIDRATYCTDEVIAFEYAVGDWLAGGEVGDFPPEPTFPDGSELVTVSQNETGQGAIVEKINEKDLSIEMWHFDAPENRTFIGPCTDTDDEGSFFADGTTSYIANDNDLFGSGTRGNAYGRQGQAALTDSYGADWTYKWRFHFNSRCYSPLDDAPSCLIDYGTLTAK